MNRKSDFYFFLIQSKDGVSKFKLEMGFTILFSKKIINSFSKLRNFPSR